MDAVTFLIRLAPVEHRTFNLEPVHHKAGGDYSEAGVSRILQMMRQRGHGQFRRGGTMHEGHRTKRRFPRGRAIELPCNFLGNGNCVLDRKYRTHSAPLAQRLHRTSSKIVRTTRGAANPSLKHCAARASSPAQAATYPCPAYPSPACLSFAARDLAFALWDLGLAASVLGD